MIILALAFFRKSRENRQLYEQILATTKGLEQLVDARTQELRQTHSAISEFIDYASQLQHNLLPPKHILEKHLGHVAAIWHPKDVVGGDFHWFGQIGNQHVLVAMDFTGHGVPGAFMTIIAHSVLEQIGSSQNASTDMGKPYLTALEILHMLHDSVYRLLHHSQLNRNQKSLDASVVILSGDAKRLNFAGAHMDIYSVPPHAPLSGINAISYHLDMKARIYLNWIISILIYPENRYSR